MRDRDCPVNSRDAYWEGRDSRSWDRNPYEHGRDAFAERDCREAYDEWNRGHRAAEHAREEREAEEHYEERRRVERQHEDALEADRYAAEQERYAREDERAIEEARVKP